jgi:hypothetical protein
MNTSNQQPQDLEPLQPTELGVYRHYKGNLYEVVGTARHSETLEAMTVYKTLYGNTQEQQQLWVRPQKMFLEDVLVNGKMEPRFSLIDKSANN